MAAALLSVQCWGNLGEPGLESPLSINCSSATVGQLLGTKGLRKGFANPAKKAGQSHREQ